ncbi:hypothetical protein RF55_23987 [Lasius niger]|uniref:DUF3627 domain-containing protein n=1 Tax=Lasius niger TaxID=67767 RepID=A0A0J7JWB4_LASNI|nr:hypothetical protein RF55_23987 [Lasius niger]
MMENQRCQMMSQKSVIESQEHTIEGQRTEKVLLEEMITTRENQIVIRNMENDILNIQRQQSETQIENLRRIEQATTARIRNAIENSREYEADLTPKTSDPDTLNMSVVVRKNARCEIFKYRCYRYYMIRCQKRSYKALLKSLKNKYPDLEIERVQYYHPNSINLYNRAKESLRYMIYNGNHFDVDDLDRFFRDLEKDLSRPLKEISGLDDDEEIRKRSGGCRRRLIHRKTRI